MPFQDHFSSRAAAYAIYRPDYPGALFAYLASIAPARELAWDCATGSGQAARGLASEFKRVVATDASEAQLAHASLHPRIEYRVATADASGLADASVDLVTVAQALHWFAVDTFYDEARRVLAPDGVIAVWSYGDPVLDAPEPNRVLQHFNREVVGAYWPPEREVIHDGYRTVRFPFRELDPPAFTLERRWTLGEFAGYLRTWSATSRYITAHGHDPVTAVDAELGAVWGPPEARRLVRWPFAMRVGRR